jgi:hypothetical protein
LARTRQLLAAAALLLPTTLQAWTGISAFVGEDRVDWAFNAGSRTAESFNYGLSIEDKTRAGLRIGVAAGRFGLDIKDPGQGLIEEFAGEFVQLYLRWPFTFGDHLTLHTRFDYRFQRGDDGDSVNVNEVEWTERSLSTGLALRYGLVSVQPFARYLSSDGDIRSGSSGESFRIDEHASHGLIIDLHVEKTAYVRLSSEFSTVESLQLHFVRAF